MAKITNTNTKEINQLGKDVAVILEKISKVEKNLDCFDEKYTSKVEFALTNKEQDNRINKIEKLVFSAVALALATLGKAILDLVIITKAGS